MTTNVHGTDGTNYEYCWPSYWTLYRTKIEERSKTHRNVMCNLKYETISRCHRTVKCICTQKTKSVNLVLFHLQQLYGTQFLWLRHNLNINLKSDFSVTIHQLTPFVFCVYVKYARKPNRFIFYLFDVCWLLMSAVVLMNSFFDIFYRVNIKCDLKYSFDSHSFYSLSNHFLLQNKKKSKITPLTVTNLVLFNHLLFIYNSVRWLW